MKCPACYRENTKVLDSRLSGEENTIRRRRECVSCGFRFSTREEMEILDLSVIKRDGTHEAYSREKIEAGLSRALEKRPVSKQEFRTLVAAIERDIYARKQSEIKTSSIGEIVMRHLKKLDKVAYIRFASVYRAFTDLEHFHEEIENLKPRRKKSNRRKKHA
ncbi:MAG: transcriptional repressor NrdR [Parcubacteria group bacterium]|nr:transcriptional repressor NrdR [Parcubacteria group bacterium]